MAISKLTTRPENSHNPKEATSANLATALPITSRRHTPNSAKKRRQMPDLSRTTATPGHNAKMSMIFRDAATTLQGSRLPACQPSPNIKRSRLPLSQARNFTFGSTCQDDTMASSALGSPRRIGPCLGESCDLEWDSSEVSRYRPSGVGPHFPMSTSLSKADRTTLGTPTNRYLGATTRDGDMGLDDTLRVSSASLPSQIEEGGKEPTSSGFATSIALTPKLGENPEEGKYPILKNWRSLRSSSNASNFGSGSDDLHSTHGVPLILPFPHSDVEEAPRSHIDTWLDGVEAITIELSRSPKQFNGTEDLLIHDAPFSRSIPPNNSTSIQPQVSPSKLDQDWQYPSGSSSNKENIDPSKVSSSPRHPLAQYLRTKTPSRFIQNNTQSTLQHTKTSQFAHLLTPEGRVSLPPKREKARVEGTPTSRPETEVPIARMDFTIHEDQLAEALAQLSPDVERHRRGRGPKRERCMSYWDEDILQPRSSCLPMKVDDNNDYDDNDDDYDDGERMGKGKQVMGDG